MGKKSKKLLAKFKSDRLYYQSIWTENNYLDKLEWNLDGISEWSSIA